ncbi:unnamed protein product [Brachionus calyciflorus]|uniref:SF3 helicase domain-containing protein n=1 Tax=Brachionus calyciflorus TaxID=104777 RepID=A0A814LZU8_9BILA|nr:unnamed protein product [Brachionus calyciflorus]
MQDPDRDFETPEGIFNTNLRPDSKRRSRLFASTIVYVQNKTKTEVFDLLSPYCSMLLVAQETHFNDIPHHHIYLRTIEPYLIIEMRNLIHFAYDRDIFERPDLNNQEYVINGILIQTVRNEKNYLKYITKYDTNPLTLGINGNILSFHYNSITWAQNTEKFEYTDPHVLNHPQYYKLLEKVHARVQVQKQELLIGPLRPFLNILDEEKMNSWQGIVIRWWNDWIINGFIHKKKQLFLWGKSNTGKTTFVLNLIRACLSQINEEDEIVDDIIELQIMRPTPRDKKFAWQDFNSSLHKIVLMDEFDISDYDVTDLKKALAGETLVANRKGESSIKFKMQMPIIMISNCEPPKNDRMTQMQGFNERLLVVKADRLIH